MNVYDFDETIFHPDSSFRFVLYCLRHYTRAVLSIVPVSVFRYAQYLSDGRKDAKPLKEGLFSFLNRIDNVEQVVTEFWNENISGLQQWYLEQKRDDDVIISASPEFLLEPVAEMLGVHLIATKMNPYTGKIIGRNCHDEEKLVRFRKQYPEACVNAFYSDSFSDEPMAAIARAAYLVRDGIPHPWPWK